LSGERQLWLIFNDDELITFCTTECKTVNSTGKKICTVASLAGEDPDECIDIMFKTIEPWATNFGADIGAAEGRWGWNKYAKKYGYRPYATIYRKDLR
jgi:hypothetical protein